ncbi:hypothetical protein [Plantactinospora sp. KBS50]|uniref:hypothetical protein n=1 Tax=Plantactinospora sp. KBS50 TaxID=2024580 RepID=UPI000BAB1A47|nr:hypothetical protein [Plantactinospora sp. KBS50]ASW57200.1 hypothetical protein CIK06_28225 [Plantactinospora sp. KBS50]
MQILIPAIVVVAVVTISGIAVLQQRNRASSPTATVEASKPEKFRVVALGAQETGKTVFLASMFHTLRTELDDGSFRLRTDLPASAELSGIYERLRDPAATWPPGTLPGNSRSFEFTCVGSYEGREYPILTFEYLDYAGEILTGAQVPADAPNQHGRSQVDLEQRVQTAHAVFGIVDGQRVIEYLRGERRGVVYIENRILPMVDMMRSALCPAHFILTKWDLFDDVYSGVDENCRLQQVRDDVLLKQPAIRNMINFRRANQRIVRLLPVSAIGRHFATIDETGEMRKRADGELRPVNVEMPLCAVIPDLYVQIESRLARETEEQIRAQARRLSHLSIAETASAVGKFLARPAGMVVRSAAELAIGRNAFSSGVADMFVEWVGRPFDRRMERVDAIVTDAQAGAAEARLARSLVLDEFRDKMTALKATLPASNLTARNLR